jgi:hypothetical protein
MDSTADSALHYSDDWETRIFDFRRHQLSHQLPAIVEGLMGRKCFHGGRSNYFTVEVLGNEIDYEIYFAATRSSTAGRLNLFIQSAYTRDITHRNKPQRKPIDFHVILFNAQKGAK